MPEIPDSRRCEICGGPSDPVLIDTCESCARRVFADIREDCCDMEPEPEEEGVDRLDPDKLDAAVDMGMSAGFLALAALDAIEEPQTVRQCVGCPRTHEEWVRGDCCGCYEPV